jgi:hypothetical protein
MSKVSERLTVDNNRMPNSIFVKLNHANWKKKKEKSWDTYGITSTYVLLKDLDTAIALENGRYVPLELWGINMI